MKIPGLGFHIYNPLNKRSKAQKQVNAAHAGGVELPAVRAGSAAPPPRKSLLGFFGGQKLQSLNTYTAVLNAPPLAQTPGPQDITRVKYQPGSRAATFRRLTPVEHQGSRSHPERPVKDRSTEQRYEPDQLASALVRLRPGQTPGPHQFVLSASHPLKLVSWNQRHDQPPARTGTSQPNVLCLTDQLGPCIGVALGAGTSASVIHVYPANAEIGETIKKYVDRYRDRGLTVQYALLGGDSSPASRAAVGAIRAALNRPDVSMVFDRAGDRRDGLEDMLGAVVQDDQTVRFVTELVSPG